MFGGDRVRHNLDEVQRHGKSVARSPVVTGGHRAGGSAESCDLAVPQESTAPDVRLEDIDDPGRLLQTIICLYLFKHLTDGSMPEAFLALKQWGNNLGVRLPAAVAKAANLRVDQRVRVSVEGHQVVITPVMDSPMSLDQRLALFDPARHGGEAMAAPLVGAERW